MTDNRTTELREKFDALGIEHFDYDKGDRTQTMWEAPDGKRHFTYETSDNPAKTARLVIAWHPTPEQAIAATLGRPNATSDQESIVRSFLRKISPNRDWDYLGEHEHAMIADLVDDMAATLGSGTCEVTRDFKCSNCGNQIGTVRNCAMFETCDGRQEWKSLDHEVCDIPNYCPNCGRKVTR